MPNINSMYPKDWEYLGHHVVDHGYMHGYPGLGFEHSCTCSCGAVLVSSRESAPDHATFSLRRNFIDHAKKTPPGSYPAEYDNHDDLTEEQELESIYSSQDDEYPDEDYEKTYTTPQEYLNRIDEFKKAGWVQKYTISDTVVLVRRKK